MTDNYDGPTTYPVGTKAVANASEGSESEELASGLKVWANVGLSIGSKVDSLSKSVSRLESQLQRTTPIEYATVASGTYLSSVGTLVLNLGSPDAGTMWEVHSFAMGGTEVNVSAAGKWGLYVSGLPQLAGAGMGNLVDIGSGISSTTLPYAAHYGTRQVQVSDQETLFAVIFGGTDQQTYVANAQMSVFSVATLGDVETSA